MAPRAALHDAILTGMARIPRDVVDAVRDRTSISEVVGRHVQLVRRGNSLVGLCPFHQERSPSFHVIEAKSMYHCFGCQASGDVFRFVMQVEGLSFVEAVRELAGPAGITIEERQLTPAELQALRARSTLYDVLEAASAFYEATLWTRPEGAAARAYLERRGITTETARRVRLGWAPDGWSRLTDHLHAEGFHPDRVREAGLVRDRQQGNGVYDAFRSRLMIPIFDDRNRVIAFGGRLLEGDGPKYINSPETALYQKSNTLYGSQIARAAIGRKSRALVVEGYFDVISLQQAGFDEAVATCGTALTKDHLERLRRLTGDIYLLLDADEAGQRAAERALPMFLEVGLYPWRVEIPGAKDPDELIQAEGAAAMEACLERRESMVEWLVRRRLHAYAEPSPLGPQVLPMTRERALDDLLPLLAQLPESIIARVAARLGVPESQIHQRIRDARARPTASEDYTPAPEGWRPDKDIVHLLWLLVHRRDFVADLLARVPPSWLAHHAPALPAFARLISGEPIAAILADTTDIGVQRTLGAIVARETLYTPDTSRLAALQIVNRLKRPAIKAQLTRLLEQIEAAARAGDQQAALDATLERRRILTLDRSLDQALHQGDLAKAITLLELEVQL